MTSTERLRALLDERGVEYKDRDMCGKHVFHWGEPLHGAMFTDGGEWTELVVENASPEQAIAATVGDKPKDNPRNYNPDGTPKIPNMNIGADPDWVDWVAGLKHEEPLSLKEAVEQLMFEIICFGGDMGPNDCGGEHCPDEGTVYTNDFINGWVNKIAATAGSRSCASCPEMDDPDSYISHLQAALKWHDEHVPRPTNPRGTCVVLEGEKIPEEVLFVGPDGVTHYIPEGAGTCRNKGFSDDGWRCFSTTALNDLRTVRKRR